MSQPKAILNKLDAYKAECNSPSNNFPAPCLPSPSRNLTPTSHTALVPFEHAIVPSVFRLFRLSAGISFLTLCFEKLVLQRPSSCHSHPGSCYRPISHNLLSEVPLFCGSQCDPLLTWKCFLGPVSSPRTTRICARCRPWSVYIQCPVHAVVSKTLLS